MAVTFQQVEAAIKLAFTGCSLYPLDSPITPVPVAIYIDLPHPEERPGINYPFMSLQFVTMNPESPLMESDDDGLEISYNTKVVPYVRTMRRRPVWYRITYQLHAFCTNDADADRTMTRWVESRYYPKGAITVNGQQYCFFRVGFAINDIEVNDNKEYHKIWTFDILADIDNADTDTAKKVAHQVVLTTGQVASRMNDEGVNLPVDSGGEFVDAEDAVFYESRTVIFNDSTHWFPTP